VLRFQPFSTSQAYWLASVYSYVIYTPTRNQARAAESMCMTWHFGIISCLVFVNFAGASTNRSAQNSNLLSWAVDVLSWATAFASHWSHHIFPIKLCYLCVAGLQFVFHEHSLSAFVCKRQQLLSLSYFLRRTSVNTAE